ncbi:methyltransferase domain-containing protein [Vannielia litorea]|uniref:Methyltransferase domain-containing protein n=1 Tax=Vannielia litorea TaxID=1217970 RepID=A0A1N6GQI9_9RHOB|nr:methyltransferase domain-containing protein [Vannielia litorea]SIO09722.1 Methyltransferase domain-containing protein [Vannielia litorea]
MHLDVLDLRNFYYRTQLGRVAQRAIRDQVVSLWPEAKAQTVVGYGFAVPLLRPYLADARRVMALMPGAQGVAPWPAGGPNHSVLVEETLWPVTTGMVDKLVCLHGLDTTDDPARLLGEMHRVLGPGGRAVFIVPNRAGLWARRDVTPFGFGRPYSLSQLEALLRNNGFVPERHLAALFSPPSHRRFWVKSSNFWERTGRRISSYLAGGVFIVEASKRVYAPGGDAQRVRSRQRRPVLEGAVQPGVEPA